MAGLIAEFENGLMAMELDSAVASDLALGDSGSAGRVAEALEDSEATALTRSGESVVGGLVASEFGSHIRRRAADSNNEHLSIAGRGEDAVVCNRGSIAVPRYRCHWPIGHVLPSTKGRAQNDDEVVTPPPPPFFESDRYCRDLKLIVLYEF
jgi:hypothetical protein